MAATDQNYRSQYALDIVFAVTSILMLASIVWMLVDDYNREYKTEQRIFRDVERAMAQREALAKLPSADDFDRAKLEFEKARDQRKKNDPTIAEYAAQISKLLPAKEEADLKLQNLKADLDSKKSFYDIAVDQTGSTDSPSAKKYKAELDDLDVKIAAANSLAEQRNQDVKEVQRQKDALESPLTVATGKLKKLLDDFDRQVNQSIVKKWGVGDIVRSMPVIDGFASPTKIEQITLNDLTIDYNFKGVTRFDRCATCHKGIARPTYTRAGLADLVYQPSETDDQRLQDAKHILEQRKKMFAGLDEGKKLASPSDLKLDIVSDKRLTSARITEFCAHPRQDLYVSPTSKHPAEKFGCTICHAGQPSGTSFTYAAHTPNDSKAKTRWKQEHDWEAQHMWDFPMRPKRFAESSCLQCHHQVTDLYGDGNKAEAPKLLKGYDLIRELGCFGCHEINGHKGGRRVGPDMRLEPSIPLEQLSPAERAKLYADVDNPPGNMRKVGPSLFRVSEKTNEAWAVKWLMAPREFRPDTKMPHYYGLSNNDEEALNGTGQEKFPATEIHGIAHYLFNASREVVARIGKPADPALKARVDVLEAKGATKLTADEKTELDDAKDLLWIQSRFAPLDKKLGEIKGNAKTGRDTFTKKGCLACHSHAATNEPDDDWPAAPSMAEFGPNLTQVKQKLVSAGGDPKQARIWLINWLKNPTNHSPRTRMPVTHLSDGEAADIVAWLLNQSVPIDAKTGKPAEDIQGEKWAGLEVPEPEEKDLLALARVYLDRMLADSEMDDFFKGKLPPFRISDLGADERELANALTTNGLKKVIAKAAALQHMLDEQKARREVLLHYAGRKAISRLGCFGCHDIPGFENAKQIGTGLLDWGKKDPARLAFEDIDNYVKEKYKKKQVVESRVDEDGNPHSVANGPLYERFFYDALMHNSREGYLHQKLLEPRSYDFGRVRAWDDRARMPQFKFARTHMKPAEDPQAFNTRKMWAEATDRPLDKGAKARPAESVDGYRARKEMAEADNREAVMTFVLGLVAEPIALQYVHQPKPDRLAEVKGRQVLDKFNCAGCHVLRPGTFEFRLSVNAKRGLEELAAKYAKDEIYKDDHFFAEHLAWSAAAQKGDVAVARGVRPILNASNKKARVAFVLTDALKVEFTANGKDISAAFRAKDLMTISPRDLIWPPQSALRSPDTFQQWESRFGTQGGAFAALLSSYLKDDHPQKNKYVEPGPFVPPLLTWQGSRTQPDWLFQFLLNPTKVRESTVLRMPKFNMSQEDARTLVDYFASVEQRVNPDADLVSPYPKIPQHDAFDSDYWRNQTITYVERLKQSGQYAKEVAAYTKIWERMIGEWKSEAANADTKLKAASAVVDKLKKAESEAKDEKAKAALKKDIETAELESGFWGAEKRRLDKLAAEKTVKKLEEDWGQTEAYALSGYRVLVNQCNKCHVVGDLQAQQLDGQGPSLNLASQRLRPEWTKRWIANPQRLIPYNSAMPAYFKKSDTVPLVIWNPGTPMEQVEAARDAVLDLPTINALSLTRYWMQSGGK
jgi:cbb3-type cytochrome oxidase cytochrome c subunit